MQVAASETISWDLSIGGLEANFLYNPVRDVEDSNGGGRKTAEASTALAGHQMQEGATWTACWPQTLKPLKVQHREHSKSQAPREREMDMMR
jgi:hypothetical protein